MKYLTYIRISRRVLIDNIKVFHHYLGTSVQIAAVIKGNAYGHDQNITAKALEPYVDFFQVDDAQEFLQLRQVSQKPTFIFGYVSKTETKDVISKGNVVFGVYDYDYLRDINNIARKIGIVQPVHIKIDTLLGRQGFLMSELEDLINNLSALKNIKVLGIYSHFANLEDTQNLDHAKRQIALLSKVKSVFINKGYQNLKYHISSTAGILGFEKKLNNPIVRLGIGLYGMWPSKELEEKYHNKTKLKPIMRWITHIAQIKNLPVNFPIGYGLTYITKKPTKIAIIPQGYSDGYDRRLSNIGEVLIRGQRCKILGRVAMNMFAAEVSHLASIQHEEEVVLLGEQGNDSITAEEIANKISTINYEITSKISPLLPRILRD